MLYDFFKKDKYLVGDIEFGGFGAMYARRKFILQLSQAFNRTPIFRFKHYVYDDPFESFPVDLNTLKQKNINEIKIFDYTENEEQAVYFDFNSYWNSPNMIKYQNRAPKNADYLKYSGYLYDQLKINQEYTDLIDKKIQEIKEKFNIKNFNSVIGVHLRRGDKIVEIPYLSEKTVFDLVDKLKTEDNIKDCAIFITSDELQYIEEIIEKYPQYNFIYDKEEPRYGSQHMSNLQLVASHPFLKKQETLTFMKNVEILKQCAYVIGPHGAQMSKIAGAINSYHNNSKKLFLINSETDKLEEMGATTASC